MKTTKILESELSSLKVESLPTRPTVPEANGGAGYTATDMKRAFDRLPLFIAGKLNSLIDDILADADESVLCEMKSGIDEGHTLYDMLCDIKNGHFAEYLTVGAGTLIGAIDELGEDLSTLLVALKANGIECASLYQKYGI